MATKKKKKQPSSTGSITVNRKALRDYHILEKFEAGIQLRGTEVKSIRLGKINLRDAFCRADHGEVVLHGCDIQPYEMASFEQHHSKRPRKLLLHKKEIREIEAAIAQKGQTVVALSAYWKGRHVKVEIGIAKGKTAVDQRDDIKKRVEVREAAREMAQFNRKHG